jgi:hypothetical protein
MGFGSQSLADEGSADQTDHTVLLLSIALCCTTAAALFPFGIAPFRLGSYAQNALIYACTWLFFFVSHAAPSTFRARPDGSLVAYIWQNEFGLEYRRRLYLAAPTLVAVMLFMPTFSAFKSAMPLLAPFDWDVTFIALDQAIHGEDPWRLLQPVLGYPLITSAISILYHIWIMLIYAGSLYFAIYQSNTELRRRYFFSFLLCWTVLGMGVAVAFSSVGPCFVGPMQGNQHFDEQMAYLRTANEQWPVLTLAVQDILIAWRQSGDHGLGRGISAFPSMHVSIALLFFLAMRHVSPLAGKLAGAYFIVICVGSVHLGYHYAVDGYASIFGTLLIWLLVGRWFDRKSGLERRNASTVPRMPSTEAG